MGAGFLGGFFWGEGFLTGGLRAADFFATVLFAGLRDLLFLPFAMTADASESALSRQGWTWGGGLLEGTYV